MFWTLSACLVGPDKNVSFTHGKSKVDNRFSNTSLTQFTDADGSPQFTVSMLTPEVPRDHDDVSKWKHFPRYWPFVRGIQRSPVNSPHKDQWRVAFFFCVWIKGWVNNREAGDLRRYRAHYEVTVVYRHPFWKNIASCPKRGSNYFWPGELLVKCTRSCTPPILDELTRYCLSRKCQDYVYVKWEYWSTM